MKIIISYTLYTDGDYSLRKPEEFGCIGREVVIDDAYYDYIGEIIFESEKILECKHDAKNFLQKFLCDGIHVSYTHYWIIEDIYNIIEGLIEFINTNNSGMMYKGMSGNQDRTKIIVTIVE